jgi:release factor glutamine methyltransferase
MLCSLARVGTLGRPRSVRTRGKEDEPTSVAGVEPIVARLRDAGCVFAEDEARLLVAEASSPDELEALVTRRVAGEPLEYVLGWAEFAGLRIAVEPGVFVPRRRTEFLVAQACAETKPHAIVVDLCCGSGALGAALAAGQPDIELYAADLDPAAVGCARRNITGEVYQGDLFDALPAHLQGRIDVLLANAPYVPTDAVALMPPEAREHEARTALDGGPDGLDVLRRVIVAAPHWLAPNGTVFVETSAQQAPRISAAMHDAGLTPQIVQDDDGATVVQGQN